MKPDDGQTMSVVVLTIDTCTHTFDLGRLSDGCCFALISAITVTNRQE